MSLDTAGLARAWNPAAERIFGWQGDEMVGQAVLGDTALGGSLDLLLREGHVAEIEIVKTRKDGRDVTLAASMAPLRDGAGTITGVMATAADITERVQQRAKAEALQQELHRSEAMGRLGTLVAGVAHEVRNPLFCMTATMDSMESRLGEREDLKPFFDVLRGEAARLNHLMSDLLDYGKPPAATFEVSSMGPVIDAAIRACSRGATRAGVTIEALADTTPAPVRMTPSRLVQVFQNLIDNTVQHSPKGSAVRVVGRLNVDGADMSVEYAIIDAGPGFRDIDLPHVMEPFFTRRRGGTGLGLSIVQRIVEQHGGTVVPANHPGGGGSVTVRLPVKREG